jgi:hypothetical protein
VLTAAMRTHTFAREKISPFSYDLGICPHLTQHRNHSIVRARFLLDSFTFCQNGEELKPSLRAVG